MVHIGRESPPPSLSGFDWYTRKTQSVSLGHFLFKVPANQHCLIFLQHHHSVSSQHDKSISKYYSI